MSLFSDVYNDELIFFMQLYNFVVYLWNLNSTFILYRSYELEERKLPTLKFVQTNNNSNTIRQTPNCGHNENVEFVLSGFTNLK